MSSNKNYRPDIDGLRAIAVLSVVIYHAFPVKFPGGFIGVDIFFVISGYLITGILIKNLYNNSFSILDFYAKRIKRIFPALLLIIFTCLCFGWFVFFDSEFQQLGKHAVSGIGFIANFIFWSEAGYFDSAAEMKPLLHLWSLGIEEQFYLVWPLVLFGAWKYKRIFIFLLPLLFIASFSLGLLQVNTNPVAAFYSPLTRFWELSAGGLLSYYQFINSGSKKPCGGWLSEFCAISAISLLIIGFVFINKSTKFPGAIALIPVITTLIFIGPAQGSKISNTILANRLSIWIGLISFPLYLWHWPLISLATVTIGEFPSRDYRGFSLIISVILAWFTYKFIETPIRTSQRTLVVPSLLILASVLGIIGLMSYHEKIKGLRGFQSIKGDIGHEKYFNYLSDNYYECTDESIRQSSLIYNEHIRCKQSKPNLDVDVAIVGDSHAEHLFIGIANSMPNINVAYYIQANPPFITINDFDNIYESIKSSTSIKKIIIATHWISRLDKVPQGSTLENELFATAKPLLAKGKNIYIVDDVPRFPFEPKKCIMQSRFSEKSCAISLIDANKQLEAYKQQLINLSLRDHRIKYIPINNYLCGESECEMTINGELLYRDNNHLNIIGSDIIGSHIVRDNNELIN